MEGSNNEAAKQEAKEKSKRAGREAVHAAKNLKDAAAAAGEVAADAVRDEAHDVAQKAEGTAHDAARVAKRVDAKVLGWVASDTGQGLIGVAVVIFAGTFAANKFRAAKNGAAFLKSQAKADHHIRPSSPDIPQ